MALGFVFSQKSWPGAGDVDDCWCLAGLQAINSVAGWLRLVGVKAFRTAAGKPDRPGVPNPGDQSDIARGLSALWPGIMAQSQVLTGAPWADFVAKVKQGRPAALLLSSGHLPPALQFGFKGIHAVTVAWEDGGWLLDNPLAPAHSKPLPIDQPALRAAVEGYRPNVFAVLMPTEAEAFRHHPLLAGEVSHAVSVERARCTSIASSAEAAISGGG